MSLLRVGRAPPSSVLSTSTFLPPSLRRAVRAGQGRAGGAGRGNTHQRGPCSADPPLTALQGTTPPAHTSWRGPSSRPSR